MALFPDLACVVLLVVVWPLYEYFVAWPAFLRRVREGRWDARLRGYVETIFLQWLIVGIVAGSWILAGRSWTSLGLRLPSGWRFAASTIAAGLAVALYGWQAAQLVGSDRARARLRQALVSLEPLLPHTRSEFSLFILVSVTAGFCEEFLFRGYLVWALAPGLGWWPAALVAAALFGTLHAYQGRKGMVRTALVGLFLTLVFALTRSLVPGMVLHALVDLGGGLATWIALRGVVPSRDKSMTPSGARTGT